MTSEGPADDAIKLRAESDTFRAHLDRLTELEDQKRRLAPSDPAFIALAIEVERLAETVLADARGQTSIGAEAHVDGVATPIDEVPADLSALEILERWRASERRLEQLDPNSEEGRREGHQRDAYRRAYQAAFDRRLGNK
jgi:hypothetical protein